MEKKPSWTQRLSQSLQMEEESLPRQPILELCGDSRVLIENHAGITEYGPERIQVQVRFGAVAVVGTDLRLCKMGEHQLVIRGRIEEICVIRGKK